MKIKPLNILCISSFFKGEDLIKSMHSLGNKVYLLSSAKLKTEPWPWASIEEVFYMNEEADLSWNMSNVVAGIAHTLRSIKFDRLIALDDFDVEKAAELREHFRIPGMGQTTARYFRDKLAMRMRAEEFGIHVPKFCALFHDLEINEFADANPAPWMLKPRSSATAAGIVKIQSRDDLWKELDKLGNMRHKYLLEQFATGTVYHVDALNFDGKILFDRSSEYLATPFEVANQGGIFRSQTLERNSKIDVKLRDLNAKLMQAFGMNYSATHSEFISGEKGKLYFLETASRVGGAHIAEMVEMSSGINLWEQWAVIEDAVARGKTYKLPKKKEVQAGIIVSLSRFQHPDHEPFSAKEVVWRLKKDWHIGMIIASKKHERVRELLDMYAERIAMDYHASLPPGKTQIN